MRYDDLCQLIISDLNKYGLSVIDDFLGRHKGLEILNEVHDMYAANLFQVSFLGCACALLHTILLQLYNFCACTVQIRLQ